MTGEDSAQIGRPQYPIASVDNALRILLLLANQRGLRLTDVSEHLSVAPSTAHRLLAMLQYRGFVRQAAASKEYEPGPALTTVAFAVLRRIDVRTRLRPHLERLSTSLGETVHLSSLADTSVVFIDAVESPRTVRVASRLGMSLPAHCTSSGKAMLSLLDDRTVRDLYPDEHLDGLTSHSLTSRTLLLRAISVARRKGYATNSEESEDGVASVAVGLGEVAGSLYALNVAAPTTRINAHVRAEIAEALGQVRADLAGLFAEPRDAGRSSQPGS